MRKMAFSGSVAYSGAKPASAWFSATTNSRVGCFTLCSNTALRGRNQSRWLCRSRPRKNPTASGGKPAKPERAIQPPFIIEVMPTTEEMRAHLAAIPNLTLSTDVPLARHTRFGVGGPADLYAETGAEDAFLEALHAAEASGVPVMVIGGGTNLIVSDPGYRGLVLRYRGDALCADGNCVTVGAGAELQRLVDFTVDRGLKGLETLAGIPGWTGAAIYGNAGAYGHSISERVAGVRFFDGAQVRAFSNSECQFAYRESIFKRHKEWIVFTVELELEAADREELRRTGDGIVKVRNEKFLVTMQC